MVKTGFSGRFIAWLSIVGMLVSCQSEQDLAPVAQTPKDCLVSASARNGQVIEGEYIVSYQPETSAARLSGGRVAATSQLLSRHGIDETAVLNTFAGKAEGFVARLNKAELAQLQSDPAVLAIEPDRIVSMCTCVDVTEPRTVTWSIKKTGFGNGFNFKEQTVWIIDTGVDLDHPDLNVDASRSRSFLTGQTSAEDDNGHGTHVAGIIGALNNQIGITGIASGARIVSLKALDKEGEGKLSNTLKAVAYVNANGHPGDVVNISLGGDGTSPALESEIKAVAEKGVFFAIAAGNEGKAARDYSPGRVNHPNVFTVSAVDSSNNFASFSNFGNDVVDVAAYGVRIPSTYKNGMYATLSGTSMAAPHVAGLLLIRGRNFPTRGTALRDPDGQPDPIARQ